MSNTNNSYRCIGKGFCGSVWAAEDGTNHAIKREDGGPGRSVTNDYNMHLQIIRSANQHRPSMLLAIPQCQSLIYSNNMWWVENLHRFPAGFTECRALISERIPDTSIYQRQDRRPILRRQHVTFILCEGE